MPSQYNVTIEMSFESELEMVEMEEKVYQACQMIFDNFDNINVRINKDFTVEIDGYQRTINECSVKQVNIDENKYDF